MAHHVPSLAPIFTALTLFVVAWCLLMCTFLFSSDDHTGGFYQWHVLRKPMATAPEEPNPPSSRSPATTSTPRTRTTSQLSRTTNMSSRTPRLKAEPEPKPDPTPTTVRGDGLLPNKSPEPQPEPTPTPGHRLPANKLILLWNTFFDLPYYNFGLGRAPFLKFGCAESRCATTNDQSQLQQAHAIIIHAPTLNGSHTNDLPQWRSPHQRWVFFSLESPVWRKRINFSIYDGLFNWTMTYRHDSDIPRMYGNVWPARNYRGSKVNYAKQKLNSSLLWFNSHCQTLSQREKLAAVLSRHYPMATYGKCSERECNSTCGRQKMSEHKFYFAAENAICRDYVTEKFFKVVNENVVPVVLGGGNYEHFVPRKAVIDVRDFKNMRHLGNYLFYLDRNDTAYNQLLAWKQTHSFTRPNPFCDLCAKLHRNREPISVYHNLSTWWAGEGVCQTKPIFNL